MAKEQRAGHKDTNTKMHREKSTDSSSSTPVRVRTHSRPRAPDSPSFRAFEPSGYMYYVYIYIYIHINHIYAFSVSFMGEDTDGSVLEGSAASAEQLQTHQI